MRFARFVALRMLPFHSFARSFVPFRLFAASIGAVVPVGPMRPRVVLAVSLVVALAVGAYTALSPSGLSRWFSLRDEERQLDAQLDDANQKNAALVDEVKLLRDDPRVLEEAVREELGYVKRGELVLVVPEGRAR